MIPAIHIVRQTSKGVVLWSFGKLIEFDKGLEDEIPISHPLGTDAIATALKGPMVHGAATLRTRSLLKEYLLHSSIDIFRIRRHYLYNELSAVCMSDVRHVKDSQKDQGRTHVVPPGRLQGLSSRLEETQHFSVS